jgi:hypothetical protein
MDNQNRRRTRPELHPPPPGPTKENAAVSYASFSASSFKPESDRATRLFKSLKYDFSLFSKSKIPLHG